jgi:hypothetical protein
MIDHVMRSRDGMKIHVVELFDSLGIEYCTFWFRSVLGKSSTSIHYKSLPKHLIDFAKDRDTNAILARKELREKNVLLNIRKICKTGKRVALKGKYLLTKEDILKVVQDLKERTKKKKTKKKKKRRNIYWFLRRKKRKIQLMSWLD